MRQRLRQTLFAPAHDQPAAIREAATILGSPSPSPEMTLAAVKALTDAAYRRVPGVRFPEIASSAAALTKAIYEGAENTSSVSADVASRRARNRVNAVGQSSSAAAQPAAPSPRSSLERD